MKNKYIYILLSLALLSACDNDHKKEIFPEEYHSVLYIKDNDIRERDFNTTQEETSESFMIIKAGSKPESAPSAELTTLTLEDVENNWGYRKDETILIPEDCWMMSGNDNIIFSGSEKEKTVSLTFKPQLLKTYMLREENAGKTWVLPIALVSDNATINKNYGSLLYVIDVKTPLVDLSCKNEDEVEITFRETEINFDTRVSYAEFNNVAFDATIEASQADVDTYNAEHGTLYAILPESAYSFEQPSFAVGDLKSPVSLKLSRRGLTSDQTYILPLKISSLTTDKMEHSTQVKYLKVTNPKFCYAECDRSGWTIAFANSEDRSSTYFAKNMLDGDLGTQWASYWDTSKQTVIGENVDDFRYPDEGTYPGSTRYDSGRQAGNTIQVPYPCCDGVRNFKNVVVVIDLGKEVDLHSIGIAKMKGNDGNLDLKYMNVDIEDQFTYETADQYKNDPEKFKAVIANYNTLNEGNNWQRILSWSGIPKGTKEDGVAPMYKQIDDSVIGTQTGKGRYLKLTFPESWRTANCMEIAEFFAKELIAIDGYTVNPVKEDGNGENWNVSDLEDNLFN